MPQQTPENFNFYVPLDVSKASNGDWRIKGLASTEHMDLQGEIVRQNSLDITPLKEGKGLLNWDHKPGPENILGAIDKANIGQKGLEIEGYLFKNSEQAKAVHGILTSLKDKDKRRLQLSIEGKILRRAGMNGKDIAAARVDKVALTFSPVNPNTYAELVKSLAAQTAEIADVSAEHPAPVVETSSTIETITSELNVGDQIQPGVEVTVVVESDPSESSLTLEDAKEVISEAMAKAKQYFKSHFLKPEGQNGANQSSGSTGVSVNEKVGSLRKAIQAKVIDFLKSQDPVIQLGQRILQLWEQSGLIGNLYEQESCYYKLKQAVDSFNPTAVLDELPAVMEIWRNEGLGLNEQESQALYQEALPLVKNVKKALAAGNYNVAPGDLTGGEALQTETLKKPKKKNRKTKYA